MSQEVYNEKDHEELLKYMKFQRTFYIKDSGADLNCIICNYSFSNSNPHKCYNLQWLSKKTIIKIKPTS
jgi:hypothetical protein